ncbi:mitochondrial carnitine/acylcarnitine carrier protein-like, partial [Tropilaelaps mercedesae]
MDNQDVPTDARVICPICSERHRGNISNGCDFRAKCKEILASEFNDSDDYGEPLGYYGRMFLAGGFGGMCLITTGHPLDTIKVRLQTMPRPRFGEPPLYTGTWDCIKKTFAQGGIRVFYKGMAAPLSSVALANAFYFLGYSIGKRVQQKQNEPLTYHQTILAAMSAAVFMTPVTIPTDRVKCLLQVQNQPGAQRFKGPIDCLWNLYKAGGIKNLYRGGSAATLLEMPASAVYFSVYEGVKNLPGDQESYVTRVLLAGGLAGALSWVVTLPLDMIKSRLMTSRGAKY